MATSKSKDGGANIRYDEFIKHIRPDASKADPVVVLHGYVGESGSEDKIRLYADESLTEFADILKTDILYAVPDQDNPLGGSRLWIKQNAEVNHTDANAYAQGDMYNNYMGTMYDGGASNMGGAGAAATAACTILTQNVICRNTVFVCPTPVSRLVICNQVTRNVQCQITRTPGCQVLTRGGCPQPSWVDGCASALGCTIQNSIACATDITRTIRTVNPGGGFADAYGSDYAGGDMYNDYMQNSYDGGAQQNFGGTTLTADCLRQVKPISQVYCLPPSQVYICHSVQIPCISKQIRCPAQCQYGSLHLPIKSLACQTDITRQFTINVQTVRGYGADYAGGDMYNDYMGNTYDGGDTMNMAGAAATAACTAPVTLNCPASRTICPTPQSRLIICNQVTRQANCLLTQNIQCQVTRGACPQPSWVDACPSALGCTFNCATDVTRNIRVNPAVGGGFADAYGSDYAGGDMYNDYMQNSYDGGIGTTVPGVATTRATAVPITRTYPCHKRSLQTPCQSTPLYRCCIYRTIGAIPIITRVCPSANDGCPSGFCPPDTLAQGGGVQGGGYADAYGADYSGGDMYNDYMQNSYDGGAQQNFGGAGAAGATLTPNCFAIATRTPNCFHQSLLVICPKSAHIICHISVNYRCPVTCLYGTIGPIMSRNCPSAVDGCPSGFCPDTLLTREIRTGGIQGGGFADAYGADYSGGDMYNDYMQNSYDGSAENMAGAGAAAAPTLITISPAGCGAVTLNLNCPSRQLVNCPTRLPIQCRTMQPTLIVCCQPTRPVASRCCITTVPSLCCVTRPGLCPTRIPMCG